MNDYLKKVEHVMREIEPVLLPHMNAETYARSLLEYAPDDQTHFEIRASHCISGVAHTFWLAD